MAFTFTLGVACKKEEFKKEDLKVEKVKPIVKAEGETGPEPGGVIIGENPFGLPDPHKGISKMYYHPPIPRVCTGLSRERDNGNSWCLPLYY